MFAMFAKKIQLIFSWYFLHNIFQLIFLHNFFQLVFFAQYISAGIMANQADFCACSLICFTLLVPNFPLQLGITSSYSQVLLGTSWHVWVLFGEYL